MLQLRCALVEYENGLYSHIPFGVSNFSVLYAGLIANVSIIELDKQYLENFTILRREIFYNGR